MNLILIKYFNSLGQNTLDKLTKLSQIGFSIQFFPADFSQFSSTIVKIYFLGDQPGNRNQFQAFLKFPYFLKF